MQYLIVHLAIKEHIFFGGRMLKLNKVSKRDVNGAVFNVVTKLLLRSNIPANGHRHGFRGAGTGTDDLRLQAVRLKHVQEGITGGHRPWETRHSRNPILLCCFISSSLKKLDVMKYSQGLAPSATISIRNEARLVSLCSRRAIIAQCKSRHFTKATRAA